MFYDILFYASMLIFVIGIIYRCYTWFTWKVGDIAHQQRGIDRLASAARGLFSTIFSIRLFYMIQEFFINILFQWKLLRQNYVRWAMHMLIFAGFLLLFFLHAIDNTYSHPWISGYLSTLNPYLFLRNLGAVMVIAGLALAVYRRLRIPKMRAFSSRMDWYAITILAIIIISGVLLEASKIVSYNTFEDMVQTYADPSMVIEEYENDAQLEALMLYWQENYGVVFPDTLEADPEKLEAGGALNDDFACSSCHSRPSSGFASYLTAKAISPAANAMTAAGAETVFWYIHVLASFIGLAYLPFSKFFHIFSTPARLLASTRTNRPEKPQPANIATRRAMELDACMHCTNCTLRCSVGPVFETLSNDSILPSEKIGDLRNMVINKKIATEELLRISEGAYICTSCRRCTDVCPAGINLQDLWFAIREELARRGYPEPYVQARIKALKDEDKTTDRPLIPQPPKGREMKAGLQLSAQGDTFSACYNCVTCTNVCPVVACYENPARRLGFLPHQIMHALGLGMRDEILSSQMLWDCVTCYACQEACPQNVRVTDILYELRNVGYSDLREEMAPEKKDYLEKKNATANGLEDAGQ